MPNLNVGAGLIDRRESDEFPFAADKYVGRGGPAHPKACGNAGGKGVVLTTAGRLLECAKGCAWQRQLGHAVSYCNTCLVVEASNGDTDRRIRQELAPGIAL